MNQKKIDTTKNLESYYKAVNYLESLSNIPLRGDYMINHHQPEKYLKRMRYFLNLIGNPDRGMKYIHITGTAGKGTVTTMVHDMLYKAHKKVGSFTSPFVTTTIEKVKVNTLYIDPLEFAAIVEELKPYIDEAYLHGPYSRPSYFELCFAIACVYFNRQGCEWVVLEVGLGGRFDATNVIEHPVITAITCIDYDHTEILGNTLQKIAYDKAGIIKPGSVFLTTESRLSLKKLFRKIVREQKASIREIAYQGNYQEASKALAAAIGQELKIDRKIITKSINQTTLQCRFEMIQDNPRVILDGAHNRSKIRSTIENLKELKYKKLHLIVAIADSKDSTVILREIVPYADAITFTRFEIKDRKCAHPKILLVQAKRYAKASATMHVTLDPHRALNHTLHNMKKDDIVIVVGSFFLAGELRKRWYSESWVLTQRKSH